jgi:hypothetical protein
MFSKHALMRWRETFGMFDDGIVDDKDPDPKKIKSETTDDKSRGRRLPRSLINSLIQINYYK